MASLNSATKRYDIVSESSNDDDSALRVGKGYWLYANSEGNLTIPGKVSRGEKTYRYEDLRVSNGTMELAISSAGNSSYLWVEPILKYWDDNSGWMDICSDVESGCITEFDSSKGLFFLARYNNISLIRRGRDVS